MLAVVVAAGVLAPVLAQHAPAAQPFRAAALSGPSWQHPLGVDSLGRDVATRMLYGARATLSVAVGATTLAVVAGVLLGGLAGTMGGWLDAVISHVVDFLLAFPAILLGLVVLTILPPAPASVAVAVGVASLPTVVRQVRVAFVVEGAKEYVLAARAAGAGRGRIAVREILPNCLGLIGVLTTLTLGGAVLESAGLAFLGLSGQPDVAEWGTMLRQERSLFVLREAPWLCLAPGLAIAWTVLAFNLVSDGLAHRVRR